MAAIRWATEEVRHAEGFAYWHETVCQAVLNVATELPDADEAFAASITGQSFGELRLAAFASTRHDVVRTRRHVAQSNEESFLISLQQQGDCVMTQGDAETLLKPGEIGLIDGEAPFRLSFRECVRRTVAVVPRRSLLMRAPWIGRARTRKIGLDAPFAALAREHLVELGRRTEAMSEAEANLLTENLCNLLALATAEPGAVERDPTLDAILAFCRSRLADPELSPALVASRFHMSVRTLHLRFSSTGESFGRWLRSMRLEACRKALRDPARAGQSVAEIAFGLGFNDLSAFNRAYRGRFGETPRETRLGPR